MGCGLSYAQTSSFVQQENIRLPGITTDAQINNLPVANKQTSRVYFDGFGRTVQRVDVQSSPAMNDMIQPVAYDNLGRQTKSYLPYAGQSTDVMGSYRPNAITTDQPNFYNQTSQYLIAKDASPFMQKVFENSPLQRLLQAGMVGTGYQPGVSNNYTKSGISRTNVAADGNILVWNPDGSYTAGRYYAPGTLEVTDGKDEDGIETLSFTDLAGQTVLKRQILSGGNLDTYYIYNMAGLLSYIITPKALGIMVNAGNYSLTQSGVNALIFQFFYNSHGQLTQKIVPSRGILSIIYDPLNRPVLMQDANMSAQHQWNYIKYDGQGRAVSQGIYVDNNNTTYTAMVNYISTLSSYGSAWFESRSGTLTGGGYYTNTIFPTGAVANTSITPLAFAYFDNYDLNQDGNPDASYIAQNDPVNLPNEESATTAQVKGMPTIMSQTTVGSGLSGVWLSKATFYDERLNPIQQQSNNQLYYLGQSSFTDIKTIVPDFTGVPMATKTVKQTAAGSSVTVFTYMTYDQMYRITGISQKYNTGASTPVASYSYNELGQVIKKGLGYVSSTTWLQNIDMRYNIRGQLLSINNSKLNNDGGMMNGDSNDVFGMQLLYDTQDSNLLNTVYHDGRLSAVKWMTRDGSNNLGNERAFKYSYDGVNRYTSGLYGERATASTGAFTMNHGWDETVGSYDANGNIMSLQRNTSDESTQVVATIDNLTYGYDPANPNRLLTVSDAANDNRGFANFTGSSAAYTYDANGNLLSDPHKGLSPIQYNVLNRVDNMTLTYNATGRSIKYTYDAGGNLIRKQAYDNNTLAVTTDYIDGFVYLANGSGAATLSYFPMPEGRVVNNAGTLSQEFIITDQQGNARISFNNTGAGGSVKVVQENSYYGFGMTMGGGVTTSGSNKQLYNGGSEWQNDFNNLPDYQQTLFRNYDAALGRWIAVDPEAEGSESITGYQYAGNNPISNNDPMGNRAITPLMPAGPIGGSGISLGYSDGVYSSPSFGDSLDQVLNGTFGGGGGGVDYSSFWQSFLGDASDYLFQADENNQVVSSSINGFGIKVLYQQFVQNGDNGSIDKAISNSDIGSLIGNGSLDGNTLVGGFFHNEDNTPTTVNNVSAVLAITNGSLGQNLQKDANQGGERSSSENSMMETAVTAGDMIDKGWTYARVPGLVNDAIKTASRAAGNTSAMKFLGRATGLVSIYDDGVKGMEAWHKGDVTGVLWNGLKAGATIFFMAGGGEEVELGWNLASMGVDALMDTKWYKNQFSK